MKTNGAKIQEGTIIRFSQMVDYPHYIVTSIVGKNVALDRIRTATWPDDDAANLVFILKDFPPSLLGVDHKEGEVT